jgi:hypothetical protein
MTSLKLSGWQWKAWRSSRKMKAKYPREEYLMNRILLYSLVTVTGLIVVTTAFFMVRQAIANLQIEREEQIAPAAAPNRETTTRTSDSWNRAR